METQNTENKVHPFARTLGPGPYKWLGSFDLGAAISMQQNGNIDGHNNAMASAPRLEAGMGTCAHCGMAIMLIQIVKTGEGKLFGVGSDCVMKTFQKDKIENMDAFQKKLHEIKRQKGKEQRERARVKLAGQVLALMNEHEQVLKSLPHPSSFHKHLTAYDYCQFVYRKGHITSGASKILLHKIKNIIEKLNQ
jgi:hypothetical protein